MAIRAVHLSGGVLSSVQHYSACFHPCKFPAVEFSTDGSVHVVPLLCQMLKALGRLALRLIPNLIKALKKKRMQNMEWALARDEMWVDVIQILKDRAHQQAQSGQRREARETKKMIKYLEANKPGAQIRHAVQQRGQ